MTETSLQKRERLLAEIVRICGLGNERVLRQQLDSFTELQIEVAYRLVTRADNGLASYWRKRAEKAEQIVTSMTNQPEEISSIPN